MGFRFRVKELVVPMRLSAFNDGELRNIVYLLTDGPKRIRNIPENYVVRQISGERLVQNVTQPLPLRIIGGTERDLSDWQREYLPRQRDPHPKNGAAKFLFSSDLMAEQSGELALSDEEQEKELLRIGERLGLRGSEIDKLNELQLRVEREKTAQSALAILEKMTLTVIDGDFPREVLAGQNLTFAEFRMPAARNNSQAYDAVKKGPERGSQSRRRSADSQAFGEPAAFAERAVSRDVVVFSASRGNRGCVLVGPTAATRNGGSDPAVHTDCGACHISPGRRKNCPRRITRGFDRRLRKFRFGRRGDSPRRCLGATKMTNNVPQPSNAWLPRP